LFGGAVEGRACRGVAAANFLKDSSRAPELLVGQATRVGENGQPITGQWCAGEDIKLDEFVSAGGPNLKGMAVSRWGIEQVRCDLRRLQRIVGNGAISRPAAFRSDLLRRSKPTAGGQPPATQKKMRIRFTGDLSSFCPLTGCSLVDYQQSMRFERL
jgi:hypothetical protein